MSRLLKLIAIPAVILGASLFATPKAEAHYGFGYGYGYYRPYYYSSYYYPSYGYGYGYYPSYYNYCW